MSETTVGRITFGEARERARDVHERLTAEHHAEMARLSAKNACAECEGLRAEAARYRAALEQIKLHTDDPWEKAMRDIGHIADDALNGRPFDQDNAAPSASRALAPQEPT